MKWRMVSAVMLTGTLLTACQRGAPTDGGPASAGAESPKPEPPTPVGPPKSRATVPATPAPVDCARTERGVGLEGSASEPATPAPVDRARTGPRIEVAPHPRLVFIYQSGLSGRVTEIGKDSITIRGFELWCRGARGDLDRRTGSVTWIGWPPGKLYSKLPWPPEAPFTLQFAPLGPVHDIKGEVKPFNNGIDSGPGWQMSALQAVWTRDQITITHPDGKVTVLRRADEPPRTFAVEWSYTVGVVPDGLHVPYTYRPSDLRVGDEVHLKFRQDIDNGNLNIVHGIQIERRPGGQIPLPQGGRRGEATDYRDRQQAYQDFEEKGTPIPLRFLSPDEREEHLAPPPRAGSEPRPPIK